MSADPPLDQDPSENMQLSVSFPHRVFAAGFSLDPSLFKAAIGSLSFTPGENFIALVEGPRDVPRLEKKFQYPVRYPPTKIKWHPHSHEESSQIFASTSDALRIFKMESQSHFSLSAELKNENPDISAPYTSFDWSRQDPTKICCSSIDNFCTIWDVQKKSVYRCVVAHSREVLDVAFSHDEPLFASVSADNSMRLFDLRVLNTCDLLFEHSDPLLRVAFNSSSKYLATVSLKMKDILIIDMRKPLVPIYTLRYHKDPVNSIDWSPTNSDVICSVSDDKRAHLWKLNPADQVTTPLLEYVSAESMVNLSWSGAHPEWIGIVKENSFNIIKSTISS